MSYNVGFYSLDFSDVNYYIRKMKEYLDKKKEVPENIIKDYLYEIAKYNPNGILLRIGYRDKDNYYQEDEMFESLYYTFMYYALTSEEFTVGVYYEYRGRTISEAKSEYDSLANLLRIYKIIPSTMNLPIYIYNNYDRESSDTDFITSRENRTLGTKTILDSLQKEGFKAGLIADDEWLGTGFIVDQLYNNYDNPDDPVKVLPTNYSLVPILDKSSAVVNAVKNDGILKFPIKTESENDQYPSIIYTSNAGNWINNEPEQPENPEITIEEGTKIELDNAPLYPRYWSIDEAKFKSGIYYIYSSIIKNNKIRITSCKDYIGDQSQIIGWVNISDIVDKSELQVGDKVEVTGTINTYTDGSGNNIIKDREIMYIIDILDSDKYKYNYALAPTLLARRQGWADSSMIRKIVEIIDKDDEENNTIVATIKENNSGDNSEGSDTNSGNTDTKDDSAESENNN